MPGHPDQMAKFLRKAEAEKDWPAWVKNLNPDQLAEIKEVTGSSVSIYLQPSELM
jgi:hypothetical protein